MNPKDLENLEQSLWISQTRFDISYMENILANDFFEFGRSGKVYTRQETLSHPYQEIEARIPLKNFQIHKIAKNVYQTTYISEVGKENLKANRSSIWIHLDNCWKLKFHQGTPI